MAKQPSMINLDAYTQLGIDPKTGLPLKLADGTCTYPSILDALTELDIAECANMFKWYNLPDGIDAELIERIMYLRGQGAMFYLKSNNTFYFLPFGARDGVDVYGRYKAIIPLSFGGTATVDDDKVWLGEISYEPIYTIMDHLGDETEQLTKAVILTNGCRKLSQNVPPEYELVKPILTMMNEAYPMARTNLFAGSGVMGVRVSNADEANQITNAAATIPAAALSSRYMIPLQGSLDFQELGGGNATQPEAYLLYMQSLDNFRQHIHGIGDGAIFEKSAHMLQSEIGANFSNVGLRLNDKLRARKQFCIICNQLWGLGIDVEVDESIVGRDRNLDGTDADDGVSFNDQSASSTAGGPPTEGTDKGGEE